MRIRNKPRFYQYTHTHTHTHILLKRDKKNCHHFLAQEGDFPLVIGDLTMYIEFQMEQ